MTAVQLKRAGCAQRTATNALAVQDGVGNYYGQRPENDYQCQPTKPVKVCALMSIPYSWRLAWRHH